MGRCPCPDSHFASFPVVVVLPEPCSPTIIHTEGGREANSGLACLPSSSRSSSRTIFTTCWSGESCSITWLPRDFLRILASSSSTTPTATSPSSIASRISPKAASRCSSVSLPCPRRFLKVRCSFSVRFSNMVPVLPPKLHSTKSICRPKASSRPTTPSNQAATELRSKLSSIRDVLAGSRVRLFRPLVAAAAPGIGEHFPGFRYKLPIVGFAFERQFEHAERGRVAHFAIRVGRAERAVVLTAGADHELADPALLVCPAVGVLRSEPLVVVVVSVD